MGRKKAAGAKPVKSAKPKTAKPKKAARYVSDDNLSATFRNFRSGFLRYEILKKAATQGSTFGGEILADNASMSPGTLYPVLNQLAADGFVTREKEIANGKSRRLVKITDAGKAELAKMDAVIKAA